MSKKIMRFVKNYRGTIILIAFLLILISIYFIVSNLQDKSPINENAASKIESFYTGNKDTITNISVTNQTGEYEFVKKDEKWTVSEDDGIELDQSKVDELAYSVTYFDGTFIAEKSEDMNQYGLAQPQATVKVTLNGGKVDTFFLGTKTLTATGYYLIMEGNNRIYEVFVAKGERFLQSLGSYRTQEFFKLDSSILKGIEINSKANGNILIQAKGEGADISLSGWVMTKPYQKDVYNDILGNLIIDKLYNPVTVDEYVEEHPQSLAPYGLDDPAQTVTFDEGGKVTTILFGYDVANEVYVKKANLSTVYKIKKDPFDFRTYDAFTFIDKLVYTQKLADLSSMCISADGKDYVFGINGEDANTSYKINDIPVDTTKMRRFYEALSLLSIRGVITEPVTGTPTVTIQYQLKNGSVSTVSLITYKDRFLAASINGKSMFYVHKTDVADILDKLVELERNPN